MVLTHLQLSSCSKYGDFQPKSKIEQVAVFDLWKHGVVQKESLMALLGGGENLVWQYSS